MTMADPPHMFENGGRGKHDAVMTALKPVAMPLFEDDRGKLTFGESGAQLPFTPQRYFVVYDAETDVVRGAHAHRRCDQFLIAVSGAVTVTTDDGREQQEHVLDRPNLGLHIPPGIWADQRYMGPDAVLLVLASEPYDRSEYILDHDEFLSSKKAAQ
jgi:UDP-2-acetamido-3-amino-2,3-dideoxy-glucuronate N-acetyltransferase